MLPQKKKKRQQQQYKESEKARKGFNISPE
jgi:hypothetical protein